VAEIAGASNPVLAAALESDRFRLGFQPYDWSLNGAAA
jgi:hypothetical protein